jgi:hypothetical protein
VSCFERLLKEAREMDDEEWFLRLVAEGKMHLDPPITDEEMIWVERQLATIN